MTCILYGDKQRFGGHLFMTPIGHHGKALSFAAVDWLPKRLIVLWSLVFFSALIESVDLISFKAVFGVSVHH